MSNAEETVESSITNGDKSNSNVSLSVASHTDISAPVNPKLKWYVVHAHSGFEQRAKQQLEEKIRTQGMVNFFGEVHVPQETVTEMVKGQKKTSKRKFLPGYILIQMELNEDTWHLVKNIPKITGFIGDEKDPLPMSEEEVERIFLQVKEGAAPTKSKMNFSVRDKIKVIEGPFADFVGEIEEVRTEKAKLKVLISIFGRPTPVELDFGQVEKLPQ